MTRKTILKGGMKLLILAVAFAILQHNGALDRQILDVLSFAPSGLVGALIFPMGVVWLNALRWKRILARVGIAETVWNCSRMILIGFYYNLVMPGGSGGDLVRVYSIARRNPGKRGVAGFSVIFDRLYGILTLCGMAGAGILALTMGKAVRAGTIEVVFPFALIAFLAGGYLLIPRLLKLEVVKNRLFKAGNVEDYLALWGTARSNLVALALSIGIHACNVGAVMSCAWLLGYDQASFLDWFTLVPLSFLVNQIPLTPGGVGLGEASLFTGLSRLVGASNPGVLIFLLFRLVFFSLGAVGYLLPGSRIAREDLEQA